MTHHMVKWETKITELNLESQLEILDQLQLEENDKYNLVIINASEDIRRWIVEKVGEKSWESLLTAARNRDGKRGQAEQGILLSSKIRKFDEDPEGFARELISQYKGIDGNISEECLLRVLPHQIFPNSERLKDKLINAKSTEDLIFRIRELSSIRHKPGRKCSKCHKIGHLAEKCRSNL